MQRTTEPIQPAYKRQKKSWAAYGVQSQQHLV
jgi:hypothetical protein